MRLLRLLEEQNEVKTEDDSTRIRTSGGGRKLLEEQDAMLLSDLESLIEPMTLGDPESPLKWTSKSVVKLAATLNLGGHRISHKSVYNLLKSLGYSLQSNRKTRDGSSHIDRDDQFLHISVHPSAVCFPLKESANKVKPFAQSYQNCEN
jgi:transposase